MTEQEQVEELQDKYGLSEEDCQYLIDNYCGRKEGADIVCAIYKDWGECAYETALSLGYVDRNNDRYFNYDLFEDDLRDDSNYLELPSGKIAYLEY